MTDMMTSADPRFSKPVRQIVIMVVVLVLAGVGSFFALPRVLSVFEANPFLNGFIVLVFVIGVVMCFWQVWQLVVSIRWIESLKSQRTDLEAPLLLVPLAALLREREENTRIESASARSILESVGQRIDESRDITRYIGNLLIFLGLLGTFYGLATTVPAVVETIRSLAPKDGDSGVEVFNRLMTGLESQLGGMGVAFASSLLGLAGSLIVGLLELFAGHGQNRFYRELEEWMSTITRFSFDFSDGSSANGQDEALRVINYMAQQTEALHLTITQSDVGRAVLEERLSELVSAVTRMANAMQTQNEQAEQSADAESRMRLRSIDTQLKEMVQDLRAAVRDAQNEQNGRR